MITGKEDLLQALIETYLMEKGTNEFYLQAASKVLNSDAKNVFKELSAWEGKHMEFIQYLYQSIQDDRDIKGFEEFKNITPSPITEAGIPVKDLEKKMEEYSFIDDIGVLVMALEIEGKAYNIYRKLSESASDRNAKVVFGEMMEQELKHIDYLKKLRIKIAETS
ncbi:MAG: ferritin family protein [Nitrospirota bacterium]